MKEIKSAGKLECNFTVQLQRHMDTVKSKLNALVDTFKLAKKHKLPRVTVITHGNLDEKKFIELLGKYRLK